MTDNNNTKDDRNKLSAVWNAAPSGIGLDDKITIIENWSYEALKYLPPWIMPEAIESDSYYFVAHSRKDFKIVYTDILRLESVGVDIWYDRSMEPGRNWQEIAERMMNRQECKGVIVYGTVNSMASKPVQTELLVADRLGKNIIFINHGEDSETTAAKDLYEEACKDKAAKEAEETAEEDRERVERFEELLTRIGNADITYIDLAHNAARKKELLDAIKPEEVLIYKYGLSAEVTGVKYIGVKSVKIPEKVTMIIDGGESIFKEECDVTKIGACAFANCRALEKIEFPETLEKIGEHAFFYCKSLTRGRLGRNISYVAENAFENCDNLMSISAQHEGAVVIQNRVCYCRPFNNETPYIFFVPPNLRGRVVLLKGLKDIKPRAFYKRKGVTAVEIPNSVTNIGKGAFERCTSLVSVTIGNSVIHIDDDAFRGCAALTSIIIPNSVTGIGERAFARCTSLASVTIPDSVTSIGWGVFHECSALTSLIVAEGNPKYHSAGNCLIKTETKMLVKGCDNSIIPSGGSVEHIGVAAFSGCNSLTSVTIPYGVTSIDPFAFNGCTSLAFIDIPDSVWIIGNAAFRDCASLTSLTIPVSVEMLGFGVFSRCVSLKSINYAGTVKQWRELIAEWRFWAKGSSCEVVKCKDGEVPVTEHDRKISYDYEFDIEEPGGDEEE